MQREPLKSVFLDGDGVLWRADNAINGLHRLFQVLEQHAIDWALLTNNNTRTRDDYVQKLRGFGISTNPEQVFTSSTVTADYLKERFGPEARFHVIGMGGLIDTLRDAGFVLSIGEERSENEVAAVVAGMDREITHEKIKVAMRLILDGAAFIATNTDGSFPTPDGFNPGTGMVIGALQATSNVQPVVIGKPEAAIFEMALAKLGADPASTAMVGDRLETDILGANRAGLFSIAVLTGVTNRQQIATSQIQPDLVYDDIRALAQALEDGEL